MKLLLISLCTTGVMREHFISYSKMFSKNNELYCVTNDNVTNDELNAIETLNVCYKRNKPFSYFSLKSLKKIKNFIKSVSPEVVYVFTPHPVNILLARFLKRYNVIFQVHDPIAHSGTGLLDKIVLNKQLKQYYKISKKFIVAGEELKRQILLTSHVTEDKIEVIPLGLVDNFSDLEKTTDETCDID
ncbi:MAG: glycosyltransferase, partial [Clostridia bacterium]|nr:glycosyltransferase [Clostridia bacterium]